MLSIELPDNCPARVNELRCGIHALITEYSAPSIDRGEKLASGALQH
jgi:hypothetical protein